MDRIRRGRTLGIACLLWAALTPSTAGALSVPLTFEFDDGTPGEFGTVEVTEDGTGGLFFEIRLGMDLGPDADLHYFYFNLATPIDDLRLETDDAVRTAYLLDGGFPVRGGAGSRFDFSVLLGHGAGPPGNGALDAATFRIFSESGAGLLLDDLLELSRTAGGLEAHFAAHVQGTVTRAGSETVGAIVPEPHSFSLLAAGILGLAATRRRHVRRRRPPG